MLDSAPDRAMHKRLRLGTVASIVDRAESACSPSDWGTNTPPDYGAMSFTFPGELRLKLSVAFFRRTYCYRVGERKQKVDRFCRRIFRNELLPTVCGAKTKLALALPGQNG